MKGMVLEWGRKASDWDFKNKASEGDFRNLVMRSADYVLEEKKSLSSGGTRKGSEIPSARGSP